MRRRSDVRQSDILRAILWAAHVFALVLVAALALSACAPAVSSAPRSTGTAAPRSTGPAPTTSMCTSASCAASRVQVFVEPEAGEAPILHAIEAASTSVWVEVYILSDRSVVRALEDAAGRRVDVRVLLEPHPFGEGDVTAARTIQELNAAGVQARQSDPEYHYTHEKALVIDHATAYILTSNLSKSGLGGTSSGANREYGVIDTNRDDVAAIEGIFMADWGRSLWNGTADGRLVVSPINARAQLDGLIAIARTSLLVEDEEMYDRQSEDGLIAAARRGVEVEVVLPSSTLGSGGSGPDVAYLTRGGVRVRSLVEPYMHAKLLIVDHSLAFTGSENFSATSLDENRELGIVVADGPAVATFNHTFDQDWAQGTDAV